MNSVSELLLMSAPESLQTSNDPSRNIWCTLVMIDDKYACGAAVVAKTLRNLGTKHPVWCMVADGVTAECEAFLATQFDRVVRVPIIQHKCAPMKSKKQNEIYGSWIHTSFTKWHILDPELFPVDKVILVDADMLFLKNCDELFNLPAPALTFSSAWANPYVKKHGINNYYGPLAHGAVVPRDKIMKAFNRGFLGLACMVMVTPTLGAMKTLYDILDYRPEYGDTRCCSGVDEQLIAEVLLALKRPIYHIHQRYNWLVGKAGWLEPGEEPWSQQYYNGKPWHDHPDDTEWDDVKQWWGIAATVYNQPANQTADATSIQFTGCNDIPDLKKWFRMSLKDTTRELP